MRRENMMMNEADLWYYHEVLTGLQETYALTENEAEGYMRKSSFMRLLESDPNQVHHEEPIAWVQIIARQVNIGELAY